MNHFKIRLMKESDIQEFAAAFAAMGWDKPAAQYKRYYEEQAAAERVVLVASLDNVFAGYVTIV
jgi:vacuolar-type H+-ATPase subunit B/Vma2